AVLHQEADRRAMRAAAETVIELLGRAHRERRRLLPVERTQAEEIGARFLQPHRAPDDVDDVDPGEQILDECLRNHRRAAPMRRPRRAAPQARGAARRARTCADTFDRSARPARRCLSTPITLPMSCGPAAEVAAIAASTSAAISSSLACRGRYPASTSSS